MFNLSISNSTGNLHNLGCFCTQYHTLQEICTPWAVSTLNTTLYRKPAHPGMFKHSMSNSTGNLQTLGCFNPQCQTLQETCKARTVLHSVPHSTGDLHTLGCFNTQDHTLQETCKAWDISTLNVKLYRKPAKPELFLPSIPHATGNLHTLGYFNTQDHTLQQTCTHWSTSTFSTIKQTCVQSNRIKSIPHNTMCKKQEKGYEEDDNMRRDLLHSVLAINLVWGVTYCTVPLPLT